MAGKKIGARLPQSRGCSVLGCNNTSKTLGVSWYKFPAINHWIHNELRRQQWIKAERLNNSSDWSPVKKSKIFSSHFLNNSKSDDPRSPSYNPTIFPKIYNKRTPNAAQNRYKFLLKKSSINEKSFQRCSNLAESENTDLLLQYNQEDLNFAHAAPEDIVMNVTEKKDIGIQHDFVETQDECTMNIFMCNLLIKPTVSSTADASTQACFPPSPKKDEKKIVSENQCTECGEVKKKARFNGFNSIKDEQALLDLTGTNLKSFNLLLKVLSKNVSEKSQKVMKLKIDDRLLVFLMKMKCNLTFSAISALFDIDRSNVSRIFYQVLKIVSAAFKNYIYWPPKEVVQETAPKSFHPEYANCRVIIDATEFFIEQPPSFQERVQFYSHYKKGYRVKVVIGCLPSGLISFKSNSYGGATSDSHITVNSGLLEMLEPGDLVLADKGFPQIKSTMDSTGKDILLVMVSFLSDNYFTSDQVDETYHVARVRIHIERIMQRIRVFRILDKFSNEMRPYCDDIISMCCVLVNLQPPILKSEFTD